MDEIDRKGEKGDDTLDGAGHFAKPTDAGSGHMAVWAVFKLICVLYSQDNLRRGEGWHAKLQQRGISLPKWL
eukprot:COSAG02_NODE_51539_length_311_cov_1.018692_1_plen_71_part_10